MRVRLRLDPKGTYMVVSGGRDADSSSSSASTPGSLTPSGNTVIN
jgi:hypothetical protein